MITRSSLYRLAVPPALAIFAVLFNAALLLAVDNIYFTCVMGGYYVGLVTAVALRDSHGRARPVTLGADVPIARTVLRARAPRGVDVPTRWRNAQGHVRYTRD